MPGPPKLPAELKKQRGTFRPNRDGPVEHDMDQLPADNVVMPSDLDGVAEKLWNQLIPQMTKIKIVRNADVPIAAGMCRWYATWKELDERVKSWKPSSQLDVMDNERLAALVQRRASDAWKNFSAAAAKLGFNPSDRARIRSEEPEGGSISPLDYFGISDN